MTTNRIAWLEIYTWAGLDPCAVHYFGKLRCSDETATLQHKMTVAEAEHSNRKEISSGGRPIYRPGYVTSGFLSRQEVIDYAVAKLQEAFPYACLLVEGENPLYPGPVLFGPPDVKEAAQTLFDRMERLYNGRSESRSWAEHDAILDEWEALIAPFKGATR